jgi:lactoylglutathione lyase
VPCFFGVPGQDEELELTLNHDGRMYDLGTGYGHIALAVDDLDDTLAQFKRRVDSRRVGRVVWPPASC